MICPIRITRAVLNTEWIPRDVPGRFTQIATVIPVRGFPLNVVSSSNMSPDFARLAKCPHALLCGAINAPLFRKALLPLSDSSRTIWSSHFSNPKYRTLWKMKMRYIDLKILVASELKAT